MSRRVARHQAQRAEDYNSSEYENNIDTGNNKNDSIPFSSEHSLDPSKIIDLFEVSFKSILESPNLQEHVQVVKGKLYNRDYLSAFDNDDKRFAYASRWTPARALAYSSLFASLRQIKELLENPENQTNVICVGGGAASELVGLATVFCRLKEYCSKSPSSLELNIVDIADWSTVITKLTSYIKSNWIYDATKFNTNFIHDDILSIESSKIQFSNMDLITLLFTTNELFCEKRAETVKLLQGLNGSCKTGSYLLIAESAGSYSHINVGTKKFPVQYLIDMILVGKPGNNNGAWEIIEKSESCWYRVNQKEIEYKMKLENMRFFYRLYRKK